jgi:hypothetical protein
VSCESEVDVPVPAAARRAPPPVSPPAEVCCSPRPGDRRRVWHTGAARSTAGPWPGPRNSCPTTSATRRGMAVPGSRPRPRPGRRCPAAVRATPFSRCSPVIAPRDDLLKTLAALALGRRCTISRRPSGVPSPNDVMPRDREPPAPGASSGPWAVREPARANAADDREGPESWRLQVVRSAKKYVPPGRPQIALPPVDVAPSPSRPEACGGTLDGPRQRGGVAGAAA